MVHKEKYLKYLLTNLFHIPISTCLIFIFFLPILQLMLLVSDYCSEISLCKYVCVIHVCVLCVRSYFFPVLHNR